nr:Hypothetical protein FSTVLC9_209 [Faustovirus]
MSIRVHNLTSSRLNCDIWVLFDKRGRVLRAFIYKYSNFILSDKSFNISMITTPIRYLEPTFSPQRNTELITTSINTAITGELWYNRDFDTGKYTPSVETPSNFNKLISMIERTGPTPSIIYTPAVVGEYARKIIIELESKIQYEHDMKAEQPCPYKSDASKYTDQYAAFVNMQFEFIEPYWAARELEQIVGRIRRIGIAPDQPHNNNNNNHNEID